MRTFHRRRFYVTIGVLAAIMLTTAWSPGAIAQDQPSETAFEFRPGVIVDPERRRAYVMAADGGVEAIALGTGQRVWKTAQAAKPLAVVGDALISQAERAAGANELSIVTLDRETGRSRVVAEAMRLPVGVRATINDTLDSTFAARARGSGDRAVVTWAHSQRLVQGIPPEDEDMLGVAPPGGRAGARGSAATANSGAFRLNLSTGAVSSTPAARARPGEFVSRAATLPGTERLSGVSGAQFVSADGRHVMSSERVGDDRIWKRFRLTIYDRSTGEPVGGFNSHLSRVPFFVSGSRVFFETGPFIRRTERGMVDEPLKMRAVDLGTEQEVWSLALRDTAFRGPFPP